MKIIHLSDLHFGRQNDTLVAQFLALQGELGADFYIISGDLTQNAFPEEFGHAAAFLKSLPGPYMCVPGNHDIPGRDLHARFSDPYLHYRTHISDNLEPYREGPDVRISGLNSTRAVLPDWNWANGGVSEAQIQSLKTQTDGFSGHVHICVMHHPLELPSFLDFTCRVWGGKRALMEMHKMGVDLILSGHSHHAVFQVIHNPRLNEKPLMLLNAGSALSTRLRAQSNSFNILSITPERVDIDIFIHRDGYFQMAESHAFPVRARLSEGHPASR